MLESWESLPEIFITSSKSAAGKENIYSFISQTNVIFKK